VTLKALQQAAESRPSAFYRLSRGSFSGTPLESCSPSSKGRGLDPFAGAF